MTTSCEKEFSEQEIIKETIHTWEFSDIKLKNNKRANYYSFSETKEEAITQFKDFFEYDYDKTIISFPLDKELNTNGLFLCLKQNLHINHGVPGAPTIIGSLNAKYDMQGISVQQWLDRCKNLIIDETTPPATHITGTVTALGILMYK